MVPKIIHQIWLGPKAIPAHLQPWMESWRRGYPQWEYRLWTDSELQALWPELVCAHVFNQEQSPALLSDVLRLELLHRFGGLYADCDFECLHSMEHLFQANCFHYADEWSGRPGNAWLCSVPGHELPRLFLRQLLHAVTGRVDLKSDWSVVVRKTGPEALARALNFWVGEWTGETVRAGTEPVGVRYPGKIVAFWHEILYPYTWHDHNWRQFSSKRYPKAMGAHHWAGSWH